MTTATITDMTTPVMKKTGMTIPIKAADIYFRIGVNFENGILDKIETVAGLKIVDTRDGIVLRDMEAHHHDADHPDIDTENILITRSFLDNLPEYHYLPRVIKQVIWPPADFIEPEQSLLHTP